MGQNGRKFMPIIRTLHIYLSMLALAAIAGLAATGFILNHKKAAKEGQAPRFGEWFDLEPNTVQTRTARLPDNLLKRPLDVKAVEAELRSRFAVRGELESFDANEDPVVLTFRGPGRREDVTISRGDPNITIAAETGGVLTVLTDLHRGKQAGAAWRWVIDSAAVLLVAVSLTGLILLFSLPRRRRLGLLAVAVGALACIGGYLLLTP